MPDSNSSLLAYAHLNLRYNPFGRLTPEAKSAFDAIQIDLDYYAKLTTFCVDGRLYGRIGRDLFDELRQLPFSSAKLNPLVHKWVSSSRPHSTVGSEQPTWLVERS